ncbi:hypothetical protein RJT34_09382 [Clitoria ternatea]|uniref:Uncharacterized protein n=1 Tax=Clitoria ternatea TaxID=43366 RepID=A0AAN9K5Q3_CLITE
MGCGISMLVDAGDASPARGSNPGHAIVPGVNDNKDGISVMKPPNGEWIKEKSFIERNNKHKGKVAHGGGHQKHIEVQIEDHDDSFIGARSPSFREYCNNYDPKDPDSIDSNIHQTTQNNSDDDSSKSKNKQKNEENVNPNKELEKKERRGRGSTNAINKKKGKGKKNILNFGCYSANNEAYASSSFDKIVEKRL